MIEFFAFLFGISIGSFLTVCIYRLPEGRSIAHPPSHCESCGYRLKILDLIPVVSGLMLRGRCRNCGARFSMRHVWVELINGALYALIAYLQGISAASILAMLVTSYMLVIAWIDYDHRRILNSMVVFGLLFFGGYLALAPLAESYLGLEPMTVAWKERALWMGGIALVGVLIALLPPRFRPIGLGDIKLCVVIALIAGPATPFYLIFSVFFGGALGVAITILGFVKWKERIPFGPFLAMVTIFFQIYPELQGLFLLS
ncbi:MAG: prepilin peptidase [Bacillota bacterium]|nr:prepilin peptidase [Bacillota bacterium]